MKEVICIGCGSLVPEINGPTHKYLGVTPGCWKIYGEVLAKEYANQKYMKIHHLTVDAYSLQHVGKPSHQTIQSMNLHLMSLCSFFEYGITQSFIPKVMNATLHKYKEQNIFQWLEPPTNLGDTKIVDVVGTSSSKEHTERITQWAKEVWHLWAQHHEIIKTYVDEVM